MHVTMPSLGERFSVEGSTERKKHWAEASLGVKRGEGEGHTMPGAEGRVQGGRHGLLCGCGSRWRD